MRWLYEFYFGYSEVVAGWIVPAAIALAGIGAQIWGASRQEKANRRFAEYQNLVNSQMLDKQLEYNTPANQMARFQAAGLNPNLIYGQGNPGNQPAAQTSAEFRPGDWQRVASAVPLINQSMLTQSQVQATNAKTRQTTVLTELNRLQVRVLERNPALDAGAYNAIIDSIKSSAEIKASESAILGQEREWKLGEKSFNIGGVPMHGPAGVVKMESELKLLEQRFNLGTADQRLKAEVLQSKEFQNALSEIQVKWMKDAEITPQHIYQFLQLLLLKLL